MNTIKKIMFMSNDNKTKEMGILKLEKKHSTVFGTIKTYHSNINGNYILGIKVDDKIIKQNVNIQNNNYNFISNEISDLDTIVGCALIELSDGEFRPILWGNSKDKNHKANIVNSLTQSINNLSNSRIKKVEDNKTINYNTIPTNPNNIQSSTIDKQLDQPTDFDMDYINHKTAKLSAQNTLQEIDTVYHPFKNNKENYDINSLSKISIEQEIIEDNNIPEIAVSCSQASLFESDDEEIENLIDKELKNTNNSDKQFYNMIADQLQELFDRYPPEENLNKLIDESYWVKINTETVNKYYVVGIIKKDKDIKYICYGVPGTYNQEPPIEMKDYSQWLPTDISDPYNNGYWVMYQDAETGENIYIN